MRLRIGIGHPGDRNQVVDYVLHRPSREDREQIDAAMTRALDVMPLAIAGEFERAMHKLHSA
jgi:PTH1 family peptidyl-tRNA hydrolase